MSTGHRDVFEALSAPFHPSEIRKRKQANRELSYITARVAMNRLDEVLGGENWKDEYNETEKGLKCRLWFRVPGSDEWLWKEDGGASAGMPEADNDEKSAYSDAFKRAAVKLGVARYLYNDGVPIYEAHVNGEVVEEARPAKHPQGKANLHPNKSGFHNGQYASPEDTGRYLAKLKELLYGTDEEPGGVNGQWADFWQDPRTGEWPDVKACRGDVVTVYGADGHIVKWLVETGQVDQDALQAVGKPAMLGRHAAIILGRSKAEQKRMLAEIGDYLAKTFEAKKDAIYRKHPELAPDGYLEEQEEAEGNAPGKGDAHEEALSN